MKQEIISPKIKRGTLTEPLKLTEPHYMFCGTLGFRGSPVEEPPLKARNDKIC